MTATLTARTASRESTRRSLPFHIDMTFYGAAVTLLAVRWGAFFIAVGYVVWGPEAPVYTAHEPLLLVLAFVQTSVLTAYPLTVRSLLRRFPVVRMAAQAIDLVWLGLLDVVVALGLLYFSGGWGSPFYHIATTSLVVPAFLVRPRQALLLCVAFLIAYVGVLAASGPGTDGTWASDGKTNLFGHLMTAVMIVGAVQFLAYLTRQLEKERDEKEELAAQRERARIAREIHDGVAQSIYMLSFNLERAADATSDALMKERLRALTVSAKESLLDVRQYIFDLKPLLDGRTDLITAVRNQAREFSAISGLPVDLRIDTDLPAVSTTAAATAYRITQESLANAFKHSGAARVQLHLTSGERGLAILVADDGCGIASHPADGNGLRNMRARVEEIGGTFSLNSVLGSGTRIEVLIPALR